MGPTRDLCLHVLESVNRLARPKELRRAAELVSSGADPLVPWYMCSDKGVALRLRALAPAVGPGGTPSRAALSALLKATSAERMLMWSCALYAPVLSSDVERQGQCGSPPAALALTQSVA